jgi:hypothetical protein
MGKVSGGAEEDDDVWVRDAIGATIAWPLYALRCSLTPLAGNA